MKIIAEMQEKISELENTIEEQKEEIAKFDLKAIADGIEKWIVEEYSPEVQKWVVEHYSPEVQKWVVEHYSPEVQKWVVEHYSPEVQKWITNEYSNGVQGWLKECFESELKENIVNEVNENIKAEKESIINEINEGIKSAKDSKLENIDSMLSMLENIEVSKPSYGRKVVAEGMENAPKYVQDMPENLRPQYNMASKEVKESIQRRARLYDFSQEGAVEKFWESIDFSSIKPVSTVNETKETSTWEDNIRMRLRMGR